MRCRAYVNVGQGPRFCCRNRHEPLIVHACNIYGTLWTDDNWGAVSHETALMEEYARWLVYRESLYDHQT